MSDQVHSSTGSRFLKSTKQHKSFSLISPVDQTASGVFYECSPSDYEDLIKICQKAFLSWRLVPAPQRGLLVKALGEECTHEKESLARIISLEMGKTFEEAKGEVQEVIDICDFALGLSRQLYGLTIASERPAHRMMEQWHPLGIVGIISAFNFPLAVWAWNSVIGAVCGDVSLWKPSEKTPLTSIKTFEIVQKAMKRCPFAPEGTMAMMIGGKALGESMALDSRIPLVSATGSTAMGRKVAQAVGQRLGRSLLELGGNNSVIVTENAHLELAVKAILFGAIGTSGQRCTTTRRVIASKKIIPQLKAALLKAYPSVKVGHPLEPGVHMGPLIDEEAVANMERALAKLKVQGGQVLWGGARLDKGLKGAYVSPALAEGAWNLPIIQEETFAPILYLISYEGDVMEAIRIQNSVAHGLSSSIFTDSLAEAEMFLSSQGSDCGIANVNIGTSGAEIGGAFGGEKDTGGGRESGSDSWKAYMRRQTNTVNFGSTLPLAQGIQFDL